MASIPLPKQRKSKKIDQPPLVTLEAAVPTTSEESEIVKMQRLTSVPIDASNLPDGMKTQTRLMQEAEERMRQAELTHLEEEKWNKKALKLVALGGSIAVGAIIAYKASEYFKAESIVDETTN